jgi:hypothetical protein
MDVKKDIGSMSKHLDVLDERWETRSDRRGFDERVQHIELHI